MIANPLVVQMQELQKQLEQTNASLSTQEELDATQMAAMDKERQRILEEIKRVKEAIAAQKKNTPTAAYDAPATNPTSTGPAGTTSAQPATSERQEFVQSAPPRRKKNEF
jgi:TolA-binding protein